MTNMDHFVGGLLVLLTSNAFLDFASSSITRQPVNTEVMVGHSTYLNCSTSDPSAEIQWYHHPLGIGTKDHEYVYAYGRMHPPYDKRFRIDKDNEPGSFDLVMTYVEFRDAGLYVCQNGGGTGQLSSAQLTVLDSPPSCESNIHPDGFIGPNSCDLPTDKVQLSCGVDYHGNIHPALTWTMNGQSIGSMAFCNNSDTRVNCSITLDAEINMDGARFVCQTTRAAQDQYSCVTDKAKVLYAVSEKKPIDKTIGDQVSCSAIANSPSCSYKWIWFDGVNEDTISTDQNLKVKKTGWQKCVATCRLKKNTCAVVPMLIKASSTPVPAGANDSKLEVIIAVVVTFILCAAIATIPVFIMWKKMTGDTKDLRVSVEKLQEKDKAWGEENSRMQEQLRQVEQLTATMLEKNANEHDQQNEEMERNLGQLKSLIKNALRGGSNHEKVLVFSNEFSGNNGSTPRGSKKVDKQYPFITGSTMKMDVSSKGNSQDENFPLVSRSTMKMDVPSKGNSQDENFPLVSSNTIEDNGEARTNHDYVKTRIAENTHEIAAFKQNGVGRITQ